MLRHILNYLRRLQNIKKSVSLQKMRYRIHDKTQFQGTKWFLLFSKIIRNTDKIFLRAIYFCFRSYYAVRERMKLIHYNETSAHFLRFH